MVVDLPNWLFSLLSFISFILCMIPLPWHLEAWNTGTCLFMVWTGVSCLFLFINSIIWNSDVVNRAPIWCDISTRFFVGSSVAIPAASLCINRRLYQIASIQSVTKTRAQKRRDVMVDLAIGVGIPVLQMILHTVVQSIRFLLIEEIGCIDSVLVTAAAFPLVFIWPIVIGLVSASYGIRTIRHISIRRAQFKEFLAASGNLDSSRYFRVMALAGLDILITVPLGCLFIYLNLTGGPLTPYVSWDYTHAQFNTIQQIPASEWKQSLVLAVSYEMTRYLYVLSAMIFFAFFGFADEARKNYRLAYTSAAKRFGLSTGSMSSHETRTAIGTNPDTPYHSDPPTMPVYVMHQEKKQDTFTSFSSSIFLPDYGGALADMDELPSSPLTSSSGSISKDSPPRLSVDLGSVRLPRLSQLIADVNALPREEPEDTTHAV